MASTTNADRIAMMRTFIRIVDAGSLSAAARQLDTTQPTISRRLQALEQQLGSRLLQRTTHQIRLTEIGERYYQGARELLETWDRFDDEFNGTVGEPEGMLRVIAPHAFGQDALVAPLAEFMSRYPGMSVQWLLHDDRAIRDFIASDIDCAIQVGEVVDHNLVAIRLADVPRIMVAAPHFAPLLASCHHPRQLENLPWLALQTFYRNELTVQHQQGAEYQLKLTPRFYTDSLYALTSAAVNGLGLAVGSQWLVAKEVRAGRLIPVLPEWQAAPLPVYITYPYARFYPAKLRLFVAEMKQRMPEIIKQLTGES